MTGPIYPYRIAGRPRWQQGILWSLQIAIALVFFKAGIAKLVSAAPMVAVFETLGWGQWCRYGIGGLELLGAGLILFPSTAVGGGVLLACLMAGGVVAHLFLIGGSPLPALVLLGMTAGIAWGYRPQRPDVIRRG